MFTIDKLSDDLWLLRGGGFGHGVGLSQSGAIEMAELGFSYEQILNHYYPNAKLEKIEILSQWDPHNEKLLLWVRVFIKIEDWSRLYFLVLVF